MAARPKKESLEESQGGDTDQAGSSVSYVSLHKNHFFLTLGLEHPMFLILCWQDRFYLFVISPGLWVSTGSPYTQPSPPSPNPPPSGPSPNFPPHFLFIHLEPILSTLVSFIFSRLFDLLLFVKILSFIGPVNSQFCFVFLFLFNFGGKLSLFAPLVVC